jgi:hypothetical protein
MRLYMPNHPEAPVKSYPIFPLLNLLICLSCLFTSRASSTGFVTQTSGDLVYIKGLNGVAPVGSQLKVINGEGLSGTGLQVIKVLDKLLVAQMVQQESSPINLHDPVEVVSQGSEGTVERVVYAGQVEKGPRIDGYLDDAVWKTAIPIEGFVQRDPDYWMPPSEKTIARIVYDQEKIYFGFECYNSQPKMVVANNMRRDSEIFGDDNIQILLDTFNDRQTGVFFFVNPLGAKRDLLLSNEGRTYNEDWDCIWEVECNIHNEGWTAEIAIPFNQLRFKQVEKMVWGINLARFVAYKNEDSALMVGIRSSSPRQRYWTSDLGKLVGLKAIKQKRLFQVKPYVLPGTSRDFLSTNSVEDQTIDLGMDLRYGINPNLSLDLSYNTDFAQVEGDQEQVNLTQFSLFFPEKREFFLEGASLFDFGEAAERRGGDEEPPTLLFYSRQIGLDDGHPVPIVLGSKLAGKAGSTGIGVLNVLTKSEQFSVENQIPQNNFSVIRIKRDVFTRSNIGLIAINKQINTTANGWSEYNRAGGMDFSFSPLRELNIQGFYARTWDSRLGVSDDARFGRVDYIGSNFSGRLSYLDVEDQFNPEVGFVNRRRGMDGFRRYDAQAYLLPRPGIWNIRSLRIGPEIQLITDENNIQQYWQAKFEVSTQLNSSDRIQVGWEQTYDIVTQPFQPSLRKNMEIPVGEYTFSTVSIGTRTSRARKFQVETTLKGGNYYTGTGYSIEWESALRPSGRFSWENIYNFNWIQLPQGNLDLQTLSSRLTYSFTTEFFLKLFVQWNNDKELVTTNFLLNYRFRPGSDLFFVYDHNFYSAHGLKDTSRAILLKLSYLLGL